METKIGKEVFVFTNLGLVKGKIVKERTDKYTGNMQYKLVINEKEYNFWYTYDQLNRFRVGALAKELVKPLFKKV